MKCKYCKKNFNYAGNIRNWEVVCPHCNKRQKGYKLEKPNKALQKEIDNGINP